MPRPERQAHDSLCPAGSNTSNVFRKSESVPSLRMWTLSSSELLTRGELELKGVVDPLPEAFFFFFNEGIRTSKFELPKI